MLELILKNDEDQVKWKAAGVVWNNYNFIAWPGTALSSPYCCLNDEVTNRTTCIFHEWSQKDCAPHGCPILETEDLEGVWQIEVFDPDEGHKFTVCPDYMLETERSKSVQVVMFSG